MLVSSRTRRFLGAWLAFAAVLGACRTPSGGRATAPTIGKSLSAGAACDLPVPVSSSLSATPVSAPLVTFDSAWSIIYRTHWDTTFNGVDWRAVRDTLRPRAASATTTGELRLVLGEMIARLHQSHFSIIPREVSDVSAPTATERAPDRSGTIGATLRLLDGTLVVSNVRTASAAARAGVRPGWVLAAVSGCPLAPKLARISKNADARRASLLAYSVANEALAGAVGDSVRVTFRDGANAARQVTIIREAEPGQVVKFGNLPPLNAALAFSRVRSGSRSIGIIHFNIWMPVLGPQFDAAVDSLRNTDGIVLDLRGNFGGVGGMAMGVAGDFLDSAYTIGTMHQRGLALKFVANPRRSDTRSRAVAPYTGPLALVLDELSISTTEIFGGGLQALGRARVFGVQTSGQALPAVTERLPNGDILYHAIADFLSPTGKPFEGDGVLPDVRAPLLRSALLAGRDPALDAAVLWAASRPASSSMPHHAR